MYVCMLTFVYWLLYFFLDRIQEGMRELDFLKDRRDVNLCSTMALMLAHKKGNTVGKTLFVRVEA